MGRNHEDVVEAPGAIILGGGIAGLFTALKLAPFPALILTDLPPGFSGSSIWAQGGIAAALGSEDSPDLHSADTLAAGAGLGDSEVAAFVAREAPDRIDDLVSCGVPFDRDQNGRLALAREAAHSRARVVHVSGDRAGAEIMRTLAKAARAAPSISMAESVHAIALAVDGDRVVGVWACTGGSTATRPILFRGRAVVLASGGIGALYSVTTNPPDARGEGLGMAARAGAVIADAEFVQFHPTAMNFGLDPAPLATEALRGEGAVLIDERGCRFMPGIHSAAELAPRDVVARAMFREMERGHRVFLDCRVTPGQGFASQFPTVYEACRRAGIDPVREPIPVAPAAHYHMGGVATDHAGRSSLPGLWCVGECACTGLHGANRLASNSLLESLVFGARTAEAVKAEAVAVPRCGAQPVASCMASQRRLESCRTDMMRWVGLERDEIGLRAALATITRLERISENDLVRQNILAAAKLIAAAAFDRRESIGAHFRRDFPAPVGPHKRSFLTLCEAEKIAEGAGTPESLLQVVQ